MIIDQQQTLFNLVIMVAGGLGGWWMKVMWDELKELAHADRALADRVAAIDVLVAGQYVRREHFESRMDVLAKSVFDKLDRIEAKLDIKADRPR